MVRALKTSGCRLTWYTDLKPMPLLPINRLGSFWLNPREVIDFKPASLNGAPSLATAKSEDVHTKVTVLSRRPASTAWSLAFCKSSIRKRPW